MPAPATRPLAVLFACGLNSVRSPMAAALFGQMFGRGIYVGSAGVRKGELDPFAVAVMAEIGVDISRHKPITFEELDDLEGLNFDLIVTLSPEAHHRALELTRTSAVDVEYWPTRTRPIPRAAASSGSVPTARSATSFCRASASVSLFGGRATNECDGARAVRPIPVVEWAFIR